MIMLPSHGQNTAALQKISGQARLIFTSTRHVFDKQAENIFAEFLKNLTKFV